MEKYKEYKDSGIEWIGEIPKGWSLKCLKFLADVIPSNVDKKSVEGENAVRLCNYVDVYKNNFITGQIDFMEATASDAQTDKLTLRYGDVIATKDSEDPNDIAVPALVKEDFVDVVCGYHLTLMRANKLLMSGNYLFWLLNSKGYSQFFSTQAKGVTRYAVGISAFKNLAITLPSVEEQTQIAQYLDHKTSQIDKLISDKEKLIDLLSEERTAIINQAVTKGLNADVPMKDSGIDWLGEVPEHWEVTRLRYLVECVKTGNTPPSDITEYYEPREVDWFTPGDFKSINLDNSNRKISKKAIDDGKCKMFPANSVLIIGIGATLGKIGFISKPASCNQQINAIVFDENKIDSHYGALFLYSYSDVTVSRSSSATLAILNQNQTKDLLITVPPIAEQVRILDTISVAENKFNSLALKIQQEIELLKEYKTALISEVVTGKVDVRELVAKKVAGLEV